MSPLFVLLKFEFVTMRSEKARKKADGNQILCWPLSLLCFVKK